MVNTFLAHLILGLGLIFSDQAMSSMDRLHSEVLLGEKRLDSYAERWEPEVQQDMYQGKMIFKDQLFLQNYFQKYIFEQEKDFSHFLSSELTGGMACTNGQLTKHYDELRYSYRLISLSYLLEGQWHMDMVSRHFALKNGCRFNFEEFLSGCKPKSGEMKKFLGLLKQYKPKYEETLPKTYIKEDWLKDFAKKDFNYYSHYRVADHCQGSCKPKALEGDLKSSCQQDEALMNLICSEEDQIYGVTSSPDAYNLVSLSNIINTYNSESEALGCLRRFSMVNSHKEVKYPVFKHLFQTLRAHLYHQYQERFLQGRVFFYGSGKEFEEKGLSNLYVMEQPLKIAELDAGYTSTPAPVEKVLRKPIEPPKNVLKGKPDVKKPEKVVVEIKEVPKSAFLQASEIRRAQDLEMVEVDMQKLRYDYVFSLNMINTLSVKLKSFMTREALVEMVNFDKLGLKEGPVPILFIKFMIDMQEHTGLYNLVNTVGEEFYVTNEIDPTYDPPPEKIKLINSGVTGGQWQIFVVKP